MKFDIEKREAKYWLEEFCYPSEPIVSHFRSIISKGYHSLRQILSILQFVEKPDAVDEDDGLILSSVVREDDPHKVFLLILDAKSFTEIGRVTFTTPSTIPADFHGIFLNPNDKVHAY